MINGYFEDTTVWRWSGCVGHIVDNILNMIKKFRGQWINHVNRMAVDSFPKTMYDYKAVGNNKSWGSNDSFI